MKCKTHNIQNHVRLRLVYCLYKTCRWIDKMLNRAYCYSADIAVEYPIKKQYSTRFRLHYALCRSLYIYPSLMKTQISVMDKMYVFLCGNGLEDRHLHRWNGPVNSWEGYLKRQDDKRQLLSLRRQNSSN